MSRPKYYWYGIVKKMIMNQDAINKNRTLQARLLEQAIEDANDITSRLPNGEARLKAVDAVLIRHTKTYEGVAQDLHYDWRTIQNWVTDYVKLVGKKAGY